MQENPKYRSIPGNIRTESQNEMHLCGQQGWVQSLPREVVDVESRVLLGCGCSSGEVPTQCVRDPGWGLRTTESKTKTHTWFVSEVLQAVLGSPFS